MAKFGEKIKGAMTGARDKFSDYQTFSRFKGADLLSYNDAWRLVYPEFEKAIGRKNWSKPTENQSFSEYKEEISNYLKRIWPNDYDPREIEGSVAAIFNLTLIYLVCFLNLECNKEKFVRSLEWAIGQASMEDLWAYFTANIFGDNPVAENLRVLVPKYVKSSFPDLAPGLFINSVDQKLSRLQSLQSSDIPLLYHSEGLANSTIEEGSGPQGSLLRYIEMYAPEFLSKRYIAPIFHLHSSLKPNTNQEYVHWLFCDSGVLIVPARNNRKKPVWLPSKSFQQLLFGIAYDALTENGVAQYENYKLFMYSEVNGSDSSILYQYLGSNSEKANIKLQDFHNGPFELLAEYFPVDYTEEVIDQSSHYTRTTTTYWTWG
jgi:hypothetical protein